MNRAALTTAEQNGPEGGPSVSKLIISLDRLDEVQPGDRLVAIDDVRLSGERILTGGPQRVWTNGPIAIPFEHDGPTSAWFYFDSLVERDITIEREGVEPEPMPEPEPIEAKPEPESPRYPAPIPPRVFLHERERKALRRNRQYEKTLRLLSDPDGRPVDLRKRAPADGIWLGARHHSHQAGMLATWYGWTERVGDYTWRLTAKGQRVLAILDQQEG